jgi:hypothetical protein
MSPPFVFSYLMTAAVRESAAAKASAPDAPARGARPRATAQPHSFWAMLLDARRPAR